MRWITLLSFTVVALVVWIVVGLTRDDTSESVREKYKEYLVPISSDFNEEALEDIVTREGETLLIDRDALE